ncbi:hypothetical protein KACHI17_22590 [Sediminibacterium sp. KACHI17]|jgi:hypothetical protein|uniref:Bacteriocin n=1 Tax=Sediminibacterium sp. KACHI17 TaxID=1751071 RepID=A0AAT9GL75_9BACT
MKKKNQALEHSFECTPLSFNELTSIDGGSIYGDLAYLFGATLRCFREFTKGAVQYQASLPPSLKK